MMKIDAKDFTTECRILDYDDYITISVEYDNAAARKLFKLGKKEEVDFICATYDKDAEEIDDRLTVVVVHGDEFGEAEYTLSPEEKLIFKEELITAGVI